LVEAFKPAPITSPARGRLMFSLRQAGDLQLKTIVDFLRPRLREVKGDLLDVGAGNAPWRAFLGPQCRNSGLDIEAAGAFGMKAQHDVTYYAGGIFPFADASFDYALSIEVLEHVDDADLALREIARVLRAGGLLLMTMPFSARLHHLPHDFRRFTSEGLRAELVAAGFEIVSLQARGNDICAIANKIIVLAVRSLRGGPWVWPAGLVALLSTPILLALAHLSLRVPMGGEDDPLGYAVVARKSA